MQSALPFFCELEQRFVHAIRGEEKEMGRWSYRCSLDFS